MSVAQDKTLCETPSVAVVLIDAGSLFAEGLALEIAAILVSKNYWGVGGGAVLMKIHSH